MFAEKRISGLLLITISYRPMAGAEPTLVLASDETVRKGGNSAEYRYQWKTKE